MAYLTRFPHRVCTLHFFSRCYNDNAYFLASPSLSQVPKFVASDMFPRPLPAALKGLTMIEQQLIARCHPFVRAYRLIGGQYGYRAHVLNLDQYVGGFAIGLPWRANSNDIPILVI